VLHINAEGLVVEGGRPARLDGPGRPSSFMLCGRASKSSRGNQFRTAESSSYSSRVNRKEAAAMFSSRCCVEVVHGMDSMMGDRWSSHRRLEGYPGIRRVQSALQVSTTVPR